MTVENLKPMNKRTKDEQREIARKGGIASGKKRRERKKFKELLEIALQQDNDDVGTTNAEAIVASMIECAIAGDTKAFIAIRDTVGEKPVEKVSSDIAGGLEIIWKDE